jgi:O-antigen/teichoic acid export membrane protein
MVWVFLGFAQMFSDAGLSLATVQRRDVTRQELSTVHWTNVAAACIIALLCYLSSPMWVAYFHEPILIKLVPWAAFTLITSAFSQQFYASAQRDFQFNQIAISDTLGTLLGFVSAVTAAVLGAGVYAILLGGLVSSLVKTMCISASIWRLWHPSWHWKKKDLDGFWRFGSFQIGDRIANYVWNNADYMLVGRMLGTDALGYYRLAFEIVVRPLGTINPILNKISYPIFAAKQSDNAALRSGYLELIRFISSIVAPMMFGLSAIAPWAVAAFFEPKWVTVATLLQILSPMGLLRSLLNSAAQINVAKGRIAYVFYLNLTLALVLPVGFWISAPHGLVAFCLTELFLLLGVMIFTWSPLHHVAFGLAAKDYLWTVGKPTVLSAMMGGCVFVISFFLPVSWSASQVLSVLVFVGIALHLVLLSNFDRPYLIHMMRLIWQKPSLS